MNLQSAFFVKLSYSGQGKWFATWAGWPSDGHVAIRRKITTESWSDHSGAVEQAAELFAQWLETGPMGENNRCSVVSVKYGQMNPDKYAVLIDTQWEGK